jgi:hypothetical protein
MTSSRMDGSSIYMILMGANLMMGLVILWHARRQRDALKNISNS